MRWIIVAVACYTIQDIFTARCDSLCIRDGYLRGSSIKGECACVDIKGSPGNYARRAVNMGPQPIEQTASFRSDNKSGNLHVFPSWSNDE